MRSVIDGVFVKVVLDNVLYDACIFLVANVKTEPLAFFSKLPDTLLKIRSYTHTIYLLIIRSFPRPRCCQLCIIIFILACESARYYPIASVVFRAFKRPEKNALTLGANAAVFMLELLGNYIVVYES